MTFELFLEIAGAFNLVSLMFRIIDLIEKK